MSQAFNILNPSSPHLSSANVVTNTTVIWYLVFLNVNNSGISEISISYNVCFLGSSFLKNAIVIFLYGKKIS